MMQAKRSGAKYFCNTTVQRHILELRTILQEVGKPTIPRWPL